MLIRLTQTLTKSSQQTLRSTGAVKSIGKNRMTAASEYFRMIEARTIEPMYVHSTCASGSQECTGYEGDFSMTIAVTITIKTTLDAAMSADGSEATM